MKKFTKAIETLLGWIGHNGSSTATKRKVSKRKAPKRKIIKKK